MTVPGGMSAYLDAVYQDAMTLARDVRGHIAASCRPAIQDTAALSKATGDICAIVAWVMVHKAVQQGEIAAVDALRHPAHQLPAIRPEQPANAAARCSLAARALVERTRDLRLRAGRLDVRLLGE